MGNIESSRAILLLVLLIRVVDPSVLDLLLSLLLDLGLWIDWRLSLGILVLDFAPLHIIEVASPLLQYHELCVWLVNAVHISVVLVLVEHALNQVPRQFHDLLELVVRVLVHLCQVQYLYALLHRQAVLVTLVHDYPVAARSISRFLLI